MLGGWLFICFNFTLLFSRHVIISSFLYACSSSLSLAQPCLGDCRLPSRSILYSANVIKWEREWGCHDLCCHYFAFMFRAFRGWDKCKLCLMSWPLLSSQWSRRSNRRQFDSQIELLRRKTSQIFKSLHDVLANNVKCTRSLTPMFPVKCCSRVDWFWIDLIGFDE